MNAVTAREELVDNVIGVYVGLLSVDDQLVVKLHNAVGERGSDLWVLFTTWRDGQADKGGSNPFCAWVGIVVSQSVLAE